MAADKAKRMANFNLDADLIVPTENFWHDHHLRNYTAALNYLIRWALDHHPAPEPRQAPAPQEQRRA